MVWRRDCNGMTELPLSDVWQTNTIHLSCIEQQTKRSVFISTL